MNHTYLYPYLEGLRIYELDIVKSQKLYYNERKRKRNYMRWGAVFACHTIEEMEPILAELLTRKEQKKMINDLYRITKSGPVVSEEEALRLDDMFRNSLKEEFLAEGIEKGMEKGIYTQTITLIKSMIKNHIDKETISKITNKSIEEIDKLVKKM